MTDLDAAMAVLATLSGGTAGQDMLDPYGLQAYQPNYYDPYGIYDQDPDRFKAKSQYAVKPNVPNRAGPVRSARNTLGTVAGAAEVAGGLGATAKARSAAVGKGVRGASKLFGASASQAGSNARVAMQALRTNPLLSAGLKWAGPVGAALAVGDLVLGDESLANKGMDVAMMTGGGILGSAVPVLGTAAGAAAGKVASDGLQWLFGDKKTPEQRKLEEALVLMGGNV